MRHLLAGMLFFSFTFLVNSNPIILKGNRVDVLVDGETGTFRIGMEEFRFPVRNLEPGWVVCISRRLFVVTETAIVDADSGESIPISEQTLLPDVRKPVSGQWMVREHMIFLPVSYGSLVIDPVSGKSEQIVFSHAITTESGLRMELPTVIRSARQVYLWQDGLLKRCSDKGWQVISKDQTTGVLEEYFLSSPLRSWLVRFRVDQGDLDSFRVEARALDRKTADWTAPVMQEGLLRNVFIDDHGKLILEYMDASIMAAIFQAKKVKMRVVGGSNKMDERHTFPVSHKRRHLFAVPEQDGSILVLIQCKDGNCYLADPVSGRVRKLEIEFDYKFEFLRGESSGIFYQADTGALHPVELRLPSER